MYFTNGKYCNIIIPVKSKAQNTKRMMKGVFAMKKTTAVVLGLLLTFRKAAELYEKVDL